MKFQIGYETINSYRRLAYTSWHALAEFVDNSTQAYFDNREALDLASEDNVLLRTSEGRQYVLAEIDDFAEEVARVSVVIRGSMKLGSVTSWAKFPRVKPPARSWKL